MHYRISVLIPVLLIAGTLAVSIFVYVNSTNEVEKEIRRKAVISLKLDITRLQNILYNLLTERKDNLEYARLNLSVVAMDQAIQSLVLIDEKNTVLLANHYSWEGEPADKVTLFDVGISNKVKESNTPEVYFDTEDESVLYGYFPVVLKIESAVGVPVKRLGVLRAEVSLHDNLVKARQIALNQSLTYAGLMSVALVVIAVLLHILVSRRLLDLTRIAEQLGSGDLSVRSENPGNDELGRLANAFNLMASRLEKDIHKREGVEEKLRVLNESLEERILERTIELDEKNRELLHSHARAHESKRLASLGEMAAGIAHEINSPLQAIKISTYRIKKLTDDGSEIYQITDKIDSSVSHVTGIIDSLRNMARESTNDPFEEATIVDIINDVLGITTQRYKLKSVALNVNYHANSQSAVLYCQRLQISQVLLNLLNNAFDAVSEVSEKWINIEVAEFEESIEIAVEDSGKGIPEAIVDKIFQPMFTSKDIGMGTGLGLSISLDIVKKHGGSLRLDRGSQQTRFLLLLPKKV